MIHLYSFSKAYRLTGHRVGAMIADPRRLAQAEKFLDTVTICPSQLGQAAALHGLRHLDGFVAEQRAEILARRAAVEAAFQTPARLAAARAAGRISPIWSIRSTLPSPEIAKRLVDAQSLLMLPGTMFCPEGDPLGPKSFRMAFANADADGLREAVSRLAAFAP